MTKPIIPNLFKAHWFLLVMLLFITFNHQTHSAQEGNLYQTYIGGNYLRDLDTIQDGFTSKVGSADNFSKSNIGKSSSIMLRWGYRENRAYGLELGYIKILNSKSTADNNLTYEHNADGILADFLLLWPINSKTTIYGKIGTARLKVESKVSNAGNTFTHTNTKWSPSYGLGMEYMVAPQFAVRAGWELIIINSEVGGKTKHGGINLGGFVFY